MNTAGVIILYHPDISINENISSYFSYIQKLYIIDNSENPDNSLISNDFINSSKVVYIGNKINNGISRSLNLACSLAQKDGFSWLLTMDQDSSFETQDISEYFNQITSYQNFESVAMFGVQYVEAREKKSFDKPYEKVNRLITSGSVINLKNVDDIGGFDEQLFIDEVDLEFCFRAISKGFEIILCATIHLNHNLGITGSYRSLKNFNTSSRALHAPIRLYYMVRNHLYVFSKYKSSFKGELLLSRKALLNRLKNNLLYNTNRFKSLKYILKGVMDFYKNKMGKIG